ncbi:TPR repeat protein [Aspergillus oryzae 100-8]|uniref:TPR repeat protein n=1 Tax=Aspergillus oryzae (strain 3.042) TaxID=1160506 RepID=I8TVW3_ASPO3|nr:TPR repeat protein [Aspergillus oryzae 3.042]KDE79089.1 TPR repeat protein [Aspergillus oryzae 100-8]|eukprot:EIT78348.1 TPR repeat protein [Aspergillus oryzae 3.042]
MDLAGVGKSHVAIEFAYRFTTEHPEESVFWVHASSIDRFKQGYCDLLDACGVFPEVDNRDSDRPMRVRECLEKQHHEWLLITDNADEASLLTSEGSIKGGKLGTATQAHKHQSILDYLPDCPHGSIIITTRDRVTGVRFTKSCAQNLIEVVSMTEAESASLIKSTATEQCPEDSEVDELAELLEHLPLAIVQAMSFIQENALTVGEYIELYNDSDETRMDLLCEPFETLGRDTEVSNALATTLMVSINHIKERDTKVIGVLSLPAFLDHSHIPKSLLQKQLKKALDLVKTLGTLKTLSLITPSRDKDSFSLHRLVQLVLRKWLIIKDDFEEKAIQAMDILLERSLSTLRFIPELHGEGLKKRRLHLQEGIAYCLWSQGRCNEAEELDILILEEKKQYFGRDHPETLESMASLASTYQNQGRWSEAEALDMYIVETRKKLLGPRHNLTLTSMANLASAYEYLGRLQEAETLRVEVLEERKSNFGEEHDSTIGAMASLGALYLDLGKMESAEVLIRRSWSWRKNYGSGHQVTWLSAGTMAQLYRAQGEFQKAEDLSIETIRTIESALGPNHSLAGKQDSVPYDMLARKDRLATIYWNKGLVRESEILERELFKESIQKLGQRHSLTLKCKYSVAVILNRHGREAEAIQLLVETTNNEEVLGPFHENTLTSIGTLSEWCGADKAISMLLEAQEARDKYSHVTVAWESIVNLLQQMELGSCESEYLLCKGQSSEPNLSGTQYQQKKESDAEIMRRKQANADAAKAGSDKKK